MAIKTKTFGTLEYLATDIIGAKHGFTTRLGGVSAGSLGSLNLGANRGDDFSNVMENYRILGKALNFDPLNTVLTRQTHSDIVRCVTKHHHMGFDHRHYPECDALITNDPGAALVVFTADCTPILLWDSKTGAVGAIHAGWRGTAQNIAGNAAAAMCREFGCDPANIRAAIGPNIGQCCFATDEEVPQALTETYGSTVRLYIQEKNGKYYPDLKKINCLALQNAGLTHIDISAHCTMCQPDRFWSHRVHGPDRGSQGAIIICGEGTP